MTNNGYSQQLFSQQWTSSLSELYPNYETFLADYNAIGLDILEFKDADFLRKIYLLLMGEYGASAIQSLSPDLFKVRFFTRIMAHGPLYEKQMEHQKKLLEMDDTELRRSAYSINNSARNPSQKPPTVGDDILPYIDSQNTTNHFRSVLDAYAYFNDVADDTLTRKFLKKFDDFFTIVQRTNTPLWYITDKGDYEI